jgi:excinuclease ABC subunit B
MTAAMTAALEETDRRRAIQLAYNEEHGITAASIVKGVSDIAEFLSSESKTPSRRRRRGASATATATADLAPPELEKLAVELEEEMLAAAEDLRFEYAARLRDELRDLRRAMRELSTTA